MTNFFDDLWIMLVIYKTKINESPAYQSLTAGVRHYEKPVSLFIYDNSPQPQQLLIDPCWNADYQHDPFNPGVSKAYNEGFKKAKAQNKKWLLLADQDTVFPADVFEKYMNSTIKYPGQDLISPIIKDASSLISPFRFAYGRGDSITNVSPGVYSMRDYKFINSGLLVSVTLYDRSGGYDERFPLDFSDLVFIERARKFASEFVVMDAHCTQSLSSSEKSIEKTLSRFVFFVKASKKYGQLYGSLFLLSVTLFLRAIKLCYRFRSLAFLKLLNQN